MKNTMTTQAGQCLLDAAIQAGGCAAAAAALAVAYDLPLDVGAPLPATIDVEVTDDLTAAHFQKNGLQVATDIPS